MYIDDRVSNYKLEFKIVNINLGNLKDKIFNKDNQGELNKNK
jgi:hypothetical protein